MDLIDDWDFDQQQPTWSADSAYEDAIAEPEEEEYIAEDDAIAKQEDSESNIFSLEHVKWKNREYGPIKCLVASGKILTIATERSRILRWRWDNTDWLQECDLPRRGDDNVHNIFLDPSGHLLIIAMESGDNFFLASSSNKVRPFSMAKGLRIETIAWDRDATEAGTKEFLIGTRTGVIYRGLIEKEKEKYVKAVYDLNEPLSLGGLQFEPFIAKSASENTKYAVLAATPTRFYQFIGGPTFETLFLQHTTNPAFIELPGDLDHTELHFFRKHHQSRATSFLWLTGPGIYSGNFSFGSQNAGDSVVIDNKLLPYPSSRHGGQSASAPLSVQITEFHFMVLHSDRFQVINQLTEAVVFEHIFEPNSRMYGNPRGLTRDETNGTYWLYTEHAIYEVVMQGEDRHIWKCFLDRGQFDLALQHSNDMAQKDIICTAQADHYFDKRQFDLSATIYAKTTRSFEHIALKFIHIHETDALKSFLLHKLDNIPSTDTTQTTMICTWLVEMYLDNLNQLKQQRTPDEIERRDNTEYDLVVEELKRFLFDNMKSLNTETTYNLISSHGRTDMLLFFAQQKEDWTRLLTHFTQRGEWAKALEVLGKQNSAELFYRFSPILMTHAPVATTNAWISATFLDPRKLIPALMRYNVRNNPPGHTGNQAIRYLQHCTRNLKIDDPTLYNYLLSLYVYHDDEKELLRFLSTDSIDQRVDLKFALHLCKQHNKHLSTIRIFSILSLFEEAVDLALEINDVDLAKVNANRPEDDEILRKRLWLKIARYVIEREKDIKKAIVFLNESEILKIEDILPFFDDFVLIDDFKEEICTALEEYNKHIEELKRGMDEATHSADLIRKDIKELRARSGFVSSQQRCDICKFNVLSSQFYLFPCQHVFHCQCLRVEIFNHISIQRRNRAEALMSEISEQESSGFAAVASETGAFPKIDQTKAELDELIAFECLLCGDIMINSVRQKFLDPLADADLIRSWAL